MASSPDAKPSEENTAEARASEARAAEENAAAPRSQSAPRKSAPRKHAKRTPAPRTTRRMLMATFVNENNADRALEAVRQREGYSEDDVSVLRSDATREKYFGDDRHEHVEIHMANKVPEGASTGALIGAIVGALAGAFGAVNIAQEIAIPALGIALTGTLASILAGIGTGGTLGGIIGGLIGAVFPEERAVRREGDFERGGLVLGVVPKNDTDADYFYQQWEEASGERVFFQDDGAWDLFKGQLLEQYDDGTLTDNEIDRYDGQRERLIGHLLDKTGRPRQEVEASVRRATEGGHYSFDSEGGLPADERWRVFKRRLLRAYEGDLTEEELDEREGQRGRLEGHLQERTGQSREEIEAHIEEAKKQSGYAF